MSELVLYGIPRCDMCRKAQRWLADYDHDHTFHDIRTDGLDAAMLTRWAQSVGWERLVNKNSLTWRRLADSDRDGLNRELAFELILEHPTLLKRPVLETGLGDIVVGFSQESYSAL